MTVNEIAVEIFTDNGSPSDTSVSAIEYWIRGHVGTLNSKIFTSFVINQSNEIVDELSVAIDLNAAAILKKMWQVDRYDTLLRTQLTALTTGDDMVEITDDGATYRRSNKGETVKALKDLKQNDSNELERLVTGYKIRASSPLQVAGDDTEIGQLSF